MPEMKVYLLRIYDTNYFKVGISSDVEQRLAALNTATPFMIEVVETYAQTNARETELQIHRMLADMHVRREWFHGDPDEIMRIFAIGNTMGIVDAATDEDEEYIPPARIERVPVPALVVPTMTDRIRALLLDRGEWLSASEVAAELDIGLQVARTVLSDMGRYGDVQRRQRQGRDTRERNEYGILTTIEEDQS